MSALVYFLLLNLLNPQGVQIVRGVSATEQPIAKPPVFAERVSIADEAVEIEGHGPIPQTIQMLRLQIVPEFIGYGRALGWSQHPMGASGKGKFVLPNDSANVWKINPIWERIHLGQYITAFKL